MKKSYQMISAIRKWGNSPALRLPLPILNAAELSLEQQVSVTAEKGRLTIEPVSKGDYPLGDLIGGITTENCPDFVDFGPPVGRELL